MGMAAITIVMAQQPVSWEYSTSKVSDKVYEVHLKARIAQGWHLYAQEQPESFIGSPTTIKFNQHPLISLKGKPTEIGQLIKTKEPTLGYEAFQYAVGVEFVQRIHLKNNSKTNISGSIAYQVCTDKMCLPPANASFSVALN